MMEPKSQRIPLLWRKIGARFQDAAATIYPEEE